MRRDFAVVAIIWIALTIAGEYLAAAVDIYPAARSDKGEEIEHAFKVLLYMAVPVFTLVVTVLGYVVVSWRGRGPEEEGEPLRGRGPVPVAWFAVTAGLTLLVMIYPGLTSLRDVVANPNPEVTVRVEGVQWTWLVSYPDVGVERQNVMVLPVDRRIRFEITSLDVLHSFWVPSFLMKIDAVPGKTTVVTLTPTEIGSYETDSLLRVQCAELCGLSHGRMMIPVSVVSGEDFEKWAEEKKAKKATAPSGGEAEAGAALKLTAKGLAFLETSLELSAGVAFEVEFTNEDTGTMHNFSVYEDETAREAVYTGQFFSSGTQTERVPALEPGVYFFRCDAHPEMKGQLTVK